MNTVMTTAGPVDAESLGVVLPHEHVFINELVEERAVGLLNDYQLMKDELTKFVEAGGRTLVELTTAELTTGASPDPAGRFGGVPSSGYAEDGTREPNQVLGLARLAEEVGVNIILGAGHYREPFLDKGWADRIGVQGMADGIIAEATTGFAGTGVRAGVIGEIAADKWYISATEERSFRAAARAQLATGLAITTHASRWPVGIEQLDVLTSEGADPRRVVIGHSDTVNIPEYHEAIAERGAYVEFDTIRGTSEYETLRRIGFITRLIGLGYVDQILLSHDVCTKPHLTAYGGRGYTYVPGEFSARLIENGVSKECVERILVANPVRALSGATS